MFTGIVELVGVIKAIGHTTQGKRLVLDLQTLAADARRGDSICVNGVCLTISTLQGSLAEFDVMAETLRVSTLGQLRVGARVNLERAIRADGRFGGHFVQGHVDGLGTIHRFDRSASGDILWVRTDPPVIKNILRKGSIGIDGVSLTVVEVQPTSFSVYLIPTTLQETSLSDRGVGDAVNLETDLIGKWINRRLDDILPGGENRSSLTLEALRQQGFA